MGAKTTSVFAGAVSEANPIQAKSLFPISQVAPIPRPGKKKEKGNSTAREADVMSSTGGCEDGADKNTEPSTLEAAGMGNGGSRKVDNQKSSLGKIT